MLGGLGGDRSGLILESLLIHGGIFRRALVGHDGILKVVNAEALCLRCFQRIQRDFSVREAIATKKANAAQEGQCDGCSVVLSDLVGG